MDARNLAFRGLGQARALIARPWFLNAALAALLGWQLAGLTWQALPANAALPPPPTGPTQVEAAAGDGPPPAARLAQLSLFGEPPSPQAPELAEDAPETELDLVLRGIYAAGNGAGIAVIAAGDGDEEVYAVGDQIAGSARITGIFPDRVMLRRGGQAEILRLPADEAPTAAPSERQPSQARG